MLMVFYEKNKVLSYQEPLRVMKSEFNPKPSIGEMVVIKTIMFKVCDVTINYDEHQIIVIVDRV